MQHNTRNGKGAILRIVGIVKDDKGNEVSRFVKDNDIYLWNWAVLVAQYLKVNFCPTDSTVYSLTDVAGTPRETTPGVFNGSGSGFTDRISGNWRVQIGGGSTGATVADHSLVSGLQEVQPTLPEIVTDGNILKIVFSSTFPFASETVVSETAIKAMGAAISTADAYIITRDTFTAQTVPAGGSITLQHELWFNGTPPA